MASSVICPCGERIQTGAFPNERVYTVISEHDYDAVTDPVDRDKLAVLMLRGRQLLECRRCRRLLLRERDGAGYEAYVREPE